MFAVVSFFILTVYATYRGEMYKGTYRKKTCKPTGEKSWMPSATISLVLGVWLL